jgi:thiol-disulfide isomerase/thioredoxin
MRAMKPLIIGVTASTMAAGAVALDLTGATAWFNSTPLTANSLRGKVVLVDIWTYSCINSLRQLPYIQAWAAKYKDAGLIVIGVHTPEFAFEHDKANVAWALRHYNVVHPVPMDNDYAIWQSLNNEYWPADYLLDSKGHVRYHHFGEGSYAETEHQIQQLLRENGAAHVPTDSVHPVGEGIEVPPSSSQETQETYVGSRRTTGFITPLPTTLPINHWSLVGPWTVTPERAVLQTAPGAIVFRFHARDLHLVLTPSQPGHPIRFKVTLDGAPPGPSHGVDISPDGTGTLTDPRLYQLIRQPGPIADHTFRIDFLDPGAAAYSFTFG